MRDGSALTEAVEATLRESYEQTLRWLRGGLAETPESPAEVVETPAVHPLTALRFLMLLCHNAVTALELYAQTGDVGFLALYDTLSSHARTLCERLLVR